MEEGDFFPVWSWPDYLEVSLASSAVLCYKSEQIKLYKQSIKMHVPGSSGKVY